MQKGLRVMNLQGAIEKSPILLSQYCKNKLLDSNIIISYFGGSNIIFADCTLNCSIERCVAIGLTTQLLTNQYIVILQLFNQRLHSVYTK